MTDSPDWSAYETLGPKRFRERFGLAFEQFRPGQRFQHRPGLTLSQQDNRDECLDTFNQQMLHFDERFAAQTSWGRCLMDSTLSVKVVMGMTWKTFARRAALTGFDEIALTSPVFGGDTLYAESEILTCDDDGDAGWGRVGIRTRGLNQHGATVVTLAYQLRVARDAGPAGSGAAAEHHRSHAEVAPAVYRERMGLYVEDVTPGDTYEHRPGRVFTVAESGRDMARALDQTGPMSAWEPALEGSPAINPLHVLAVVTGMQTKTFSRIVANLAWLQVRFPEPVGDGDQVFAETTVIDARPSESRPGQGVIHLRGTAATAEGRPVCAFERKVLVHARGQGPYEDAGY